MKAIDVFNKLFNMSQSYLFSSRSRDSKRNVPGAIINLLSEEERKVLSELKSEDIEKVESIPRDHLQLLEVEVYPQSIDSMNKRNKKDCDF